MMRHTAARMLGALLLGLLLPFAGTAQSEPADVSASERRAVLVNAARLLDSLYVHAEVGAAMRRAIESTTLAGGYDDITRPQLLADSLTRQLRAISHDKHVRVIFDPADPRLRQDAPDTTDRADRHRRMLQELTDGNYGLPRVAVLPGGIGYLELRSFVYPGVGTDALAAAMSFVANTRALIVDLRQNGGGHGDMVALFASYFFDEPIQTGAMYFREEDRLYQFWTYASVPGRRYGQQRPVYVLTGDSTFSAAEAFAGIMKRFDRGDVIGSQTRGGGHMGNFFPIADRFLAFVPLAEPRDPNPGEEVEGNGITPDVLVPASEALDRAYLEALLGIHTNLTDTRDRAAYSTLIEQARRGGTPGFLQQ